MKTKQGVNKQLFFLILAVAAGLASYLLPLPESVRTRGGAVLTPHGQAAMAVLVFAVVLWMTEGLPFHITGLFGMLLLTLLRVDSFKEIVTAGFGNHIIIFFIGILILSSFITASGLGRRISVFLLSKTGNRTSLIVLGFLFVGALLSMWITNMAVAAMLMPLGRSILQEEGVTPLESKFGKSLMISAAWGPIIGGIASPAGAGPNPLAVGFMKEMAGVDVTFLDWMTYGVPAALLLVLPAWGILMLFFRPEMRTLKKSRHELEEEYRALPRMDREEILTLVVFTLTVFIWLTIPWWERWLGITIPISLPVLFTACLFFFPGMSRIRWEKIEKEVSWNGILLVVSGISLGMMLYRTGAANWLSVVTLSGIRGLHPLLQVLAVVVIVSLLKIAFSSNTVTATIIIPIMIALAGNLNIEVASITLPAALTSSLAFILVTSSPTNVIPYSAGYFRIKDMATAGLAMTAVGAVILSVSMYVIGRLTGLY
jgi:sodium-dependent dicarboxylate transporter 2/3/5